MCACSRVCACLSQVRDPGLAHGAGDGLHRRAQRVEQRGQLPRALGPPALLHHEAGHGDHVGVERPAVGHPAAATEAAGRAAALKCQKRGNWWQREEAEGPIQGWGGGVAARPPRARAAMKR